MGQRVDEVYVRLLHPFEDFNGVVAVGPRDGDDYVPSDAGSRGNALRRVSGGAGSVSIWRCHVDFVSGGVLRPRTIASGGIRELV